VNLSRDPDSLFDLLPSTLAERLRLWLSRRDRDAPAGGQRVFV
jgi:hypothetical protein